MSFLKQPFARPRSQYILMLSLWLQTFMPNVRRSCSNHVVIISKKPRQTASQFLERLDVKYC